MGQTLFGRTGNLLEAIKYEIRGKGILSEGFDTLSGSVGMFSQFSRQAEN
ncbi:MAG: hypothetical protein Q8S11_10175 [Daejeonella sp.]|nr:hypothetical protein [Daejeonella sp.]